MNVWVSGQVVFRDLGHWSKKHEVPFGTKVCDRGQQLQVHSFINYSTEPNSWVRNIDLVVWIHSNLASRREELSVDTAGEAMNRRMLAPFAFIQAFPARE